MNGIQVTSPILTSMLLAYCNEERGNNTTNKRHLENIIFQRTKSENIEYDFHFSSNLLYCIKLLLILRASFTIVWAPGKSKCGGPYQ
jgi:hypothetical protein